MKKVLFGSLVGSGSLLVALTAYAGTWTSYVTIAKLSLQGDAYYVTPVGTAINPAGTCTNTDYYEVSTGQSAAQKDASNKTLLAAFLAGKKVNLQLSDGACGATGRPAYYQVNIHKDE